MRTCKYINLSALIFGALVLTACEDFLRVEPPKTVLIRSTVFDNDLTATASLIDIYSQMTGGFTGGSLEGFTYNGSLLSDELALFSTEQNFREFYLNDVLKANGRVSSSWNGLYNLIYRANAVIEGLENSNAITPSLKQQLIGEARFIRAFCNFYLVNTFGNVPLITTTDYKVNSMASQVSISEIYNSIVTDLSASQDLLAADYSFSENERTRPNKWVATALLARVYLFMEEWEKAEGQATLVINEISIYSLVPHNEVFLRNSLEAIWQLESIGFASEGDIFIVTSFPSNSALSNELINSFEPQDMRWDNWVGSIAIESGTWYFPFKYKTSFANPDGSEYSMVMRLAEQFLIRSEARAMQDKLSDAISDLDMVRSRAELPLIASTNPSISMDNLLLSIERERRIELFAEWGHRWLDLKRTDRANALLPIVKGTHWQSDDQLLPIPQSEILSNKNLRQNPGY